MRCAGVLAHCDRALAHWHNGPEARRSALEPTCGPGALTQALRCLCAVRRAAEARPLSLRTGLQAPAHWAGLWWTGLGAPQARILGLACVLRCEAAAHSARLWRTGLWLRHTARWPWRTARGARFYVRTPPGGSDSRLELVRLARGSWLVDEHRPFRNPGPSI